MHDTANAGILTTDTWKAHVSPCFCVAPGWRKRRMIMGAGQNLHQVVLPFALRLADVEEMFELKFIRLLCFS